jgi:cell division protein ZapA
VSDQSIPVTVQILDKDYRIACTPGDEQGLMESARLLDKRMREVRQNGRVIGADRIAVMAALNVIYELQQRSAAAALDTERLARLQERLDSALGTGDATAGVDDSGKSV